MNKIKKFSIYHPIEGKINSACTHNYLYEYITTIKAASIVKSFIKAQNPDAYYGTLGKRDTTTGDLITVESKLYMVHEEGKFKRIFPNKPLYNKIMETDEAIIEILSRRTLTDKDVELLLNNL